MHLQGDTMMVVTEMTDLFLFLHLRLGNLHLSLLRSAFHHCDVRTHIILGALHVVESESQVLNLGQQVRRWNMGG